MGNTTLLCACRQYHADRAKLEPSKRRGGSSAACSCACNTPGGREDEGKHPEGVCSKGLEDGEGKCGGFAAACVGRPDDVPACQYCLNAALLHLQQQARPNFTATAKRHLCVSKILWLRSRRERQ